MRAPGPRLGTALSFRSVLRRGYNRGELTEASMPRRRIFGILFAAAMTVSVQARTVVQPADIVAQTQPSTNAVAESLQVVVAAVQGKVQVRQSEDQPWQDAVKGMVVGE